VKRFALGLVFCCLLGIIVFGQGRVTKAPRRLDTTPQCIPNPDPLLQGILSAQDVCAIIQNAATAVSSPLVIAVTDRQGNVLAVFDKAGAPATTTGNFYGDPSLGAATDAHEVAVGLARTGTFFANDQAPLSSRTVRFITETHFPPGVIDTFNDGQYGIENTNRGCPFDQTLSSMPLTPFNATLAPGVNLPRSTNIAGTGPGAGIVTGKKDVLDSDQNAVNPGGVPLYKNKIEVGGIGVVAPAGPMSAAIAEYAAFIAAESPPVKIFAPPPGIVLAGGVALPFINQTTLPAGVGAGSTADYTGGSYFVNPVGSPAPDPVGFLVQPQAGMYLTVDDLMSITTLANTQAATTRAVIRLPPGEPAKFVISISDLDGTVLSIYREPDATIFSIDVSVAKSRNVIYFSQFPGTDLAGIPAGTAVTNRTINFGAQPNFPPGIDGTPAGPFFDLFQFDVANPCTMGSNHVFNPLNLNGVLFFAGSLPLYKNGMLVGGLGVSGDGVDQDDFVTAAGAINFQAPANIRADQITIRNVRMPYQKFPRDPTLP
jgi:uncharacterized protein GlcG (DUF336 family)